MQKLLLRLLMCCAVFWLYDLPVHAQQAKQVSQDTSDFPYWIQMMQDPNANFYSTQSAFYKYWANRNTEQKGNGYKVFKRWEYIHESHILPDGKRQAPDYVKNTHETAMKNLPVQRSMASSCDWSLVGPAVLPANSTAQPNGMGRINAIAFHPTDANTIYAGAPAGGLWKTTDGGATWTLISGGIPTLGVSSILIHPTNPDIIYLGSGDRDSDDAPGLGVFKSTDGGATWTQINSTMGNVTVNAMAMSPTNPNIIVAATSGGVYRTTDGGSSWSFRISGSLWKDVKFKPGDGNIVYAAYGGTLWRSTNAGINWSPITLPVTGGRIVIGVTPANPGYVYLAQSSSATEVFAGLMRSTDSGASFTTMSTTPNIYDYSCDGSGASSQAFYDLCINVDPNDANTLYVGCINVWKSTNGGATWSIKSHWVGASFSDPCGGTASMHADQHALEWSPLNGRLYAGNDGGVYWTNNGGNTWTDISSGLAISQVYKIGQSATTQDQMMHGYQDNGTCVSTGASFTTIGGGDGFECYIDYSNANYKYRATNGGLSRSSGGGYSSIATYATNGISDLSSVFAFPSILHKTNPNTLFLGYQNVWRTTNAKASPASSVSWSAISTGETVRCKVLEQSAADNNILYVVRTGQIKRSDNANDAAASVVWNSCTLPDGLTPTDLEAHPTDPNIVYATAGYGVYKSTDKGLNWVNISGTLPSLFTNCLVYDKNSNEGIYVGNQTGIWYKDANMADWMFYSTSLPTVDIREIEIYYNASDRSSERVKAATYGRGTWENKLLSSPPVFNCANLTTVNLYSAGHICGNDTNLTIPVGTDNCDGDIAATGTRSDAAALNNPWPLGTTTITWTFTDGVGSTHQCTQTVNVIDNWTPIVGGCPGNIYRSTGSNSCPIAVNWTAPTASDNCDLNLAQTQSHTPGSSFQAGTTTVTYTFTDDSGNTSYCTFFVNITDNSSPVISDCPSNIVAPSGAGCETPVYWTPPTALDNCDQNLAQTASHNPGSLFQNGTTTINYTFTDDAGNTAYCSFTVTINCQINFSGRVIWKRNITLGVKDVNVAVSGDQSGSAITPLSGNYSIITPSGANFVITPSKNLNKFNGVNAQDVGRIQQHLSGAIFTDPYDWVAADVNGNDAITSLDANIIQLALLGNTTALAQFPKSWRFVPAAHSMLTPPWGFPEKITLNGISGDQPNQDFYGIKIGDVAATYANPANGGAGNPLVLRLENKVLQAGELFSVGVAADPLADISAFQFALRFNPEYLLLESIESLDALPLTAENFGAYEAESGSLRVVWANTLTAPSLRTQKVLFRLSFRALSSGKSLQDLLQLDQETLPGMVYNSQNKESAVQLRFDGLSAAHDPNTSTQALQLDAHPNPFGTATTLVFYLPEDGNTHLRIVDASGRIVLQQNNLYSAGRHEAKIDLLQWPAGVYTCELRTSRGIATHRIIKL